MSQTCPRCYRIVHRACQSETEWVDCAEIAWLNLQDLADLKALEEQDAKRAERMARIMEIVRNNAQVALDQNQIDEYEDNLGDDLCEYVKDATDNEIGWAYEQYSKLVGR